MTLTIKTILIALTFLPILGIAQNIGINDDGATPNSNAILDIAVTTNDKGILIPRISSVQRVAIAGLGAGDEALTVFDTTTDSYWLWDGAKWVEFTMAGKAWNLVGNTGTTPGTDFIGTTDAQDLYIYTDNAEKLRITTGGHIRMTTTVDTDPSYAWQGDLNTGMKRIGADNLAIVAGGTSLVELTETGTGNEVKINPGTTDDTDFKVESMSNTDLFLVSGANDQVSVNTPTPIAGDFFTSSGNYAINAYSTAANATNVYSEATGNGGVAFYGFADGTASVAVVGVGEATQAIVPPEGAGGAFTGQDIGLAVYRYSDENTNDEGAAYFIGRMDLITLAPEKSAYVSTRIGGTWYKINGDGSVATIVDHPEGGKVNMFCPEAPEILFEDYGQGELINGEAKITLDPIFTHNVTINEKHPLRVYVQLEGDCKGVYVTNKSKVGFTVKELAKGKSNVPFSYHVVANRKDDLYADGSVDSKNADVRFPKSPTRKLAKKAPKFKKKNLPK
jgi:hypothetical protein